MTLISKNAIRVSAEGCTDLFIHDEINPAIIHHKFSAFTCCCFSGVKLDLLFLGHYPNCKHFYFFIVLVENLSRCACLSWRFPQESNKDLCCLLVALQGYGLCDYTNLSKCACQFNTVRTCAYWESTQVCHLSYMCEHVIDAVRGPCFASRGQQLSQDTPWGQHLA